MLTPPSAVAWRASDTLRRAVATQPVSSAGSLLGEATKRRRVGSGGGSLPPSRSCCARGLGSVAWEFLAARGGTTRSLRVGFAAIVVALPHIDLAHGVGALASAMAAYGLGLGLVDAGCNMRAVAIEHRYGRPLMSTFHAAWTRGGVLGTLIALATHRWGFALAAAVLMILTAAATLAPYVPHVRPEPAPITSGADAPAARSLPWRASSPSASRSSCSTSSTRP